MRKERGRQNHVKLKGRWVEKKVNGGEDEE